MLKGSLQDRLRLGPVHIAGGIVVGVAAIAVVTFWAGQSGNLADARAARATEVGLGPRVQAVEAMQGPTERSIQLLADVKPYQNAILYAKVSGYLKAIHVDRGDRVKAGQIVAEVESAETDSQYAAAKADLENKRKLLARSRDLRATGNASAQTFEQAETNERMASALVSQLEVLRSYQIIRAPFDGTVTARFADPGALIQNAGTSQTNALPVVTITDSSRLRVAVYVSQADAPLVHIGSPVEVVDASNSSRHVTATISRTSEILDPTTRTLMVESDVNNSNGFLFPGSFAYVTLKAPVQSYVRIPATGLVVRNSQQMVAVVGADSQIQLRQVRVASTDGMVVDLLEGLKPGERIALSIPDEVTDGSRVQAVDVARRGS